MPYRKDQNLNAWVEMLHAIYGRSQNYARTEYEILAHLSEVTGAFSKYLFKLNQPDRAKEFLPKMFGWSAALLKKVKGEHSNLEDVILTKYPCVCPDSEDVFLAEDLFWPAYPGICVVCMLDICDCRPSPVRELLSKPALGDLRYVDGLTQAANKAQFDLQVGDIKDGALPFPVPISAVRIDVDDFKKFNEPPFDHGVGDQTLKHIVNVIRQKIRTRDRVYRVGGDEFALLCPDMSAAEAEGMMFRVAKALKDKPVPVASRDDHPVPTITLSTGIAECLASAAIMRAFEAADQAAIDSKAAGKDRITVRQTPDEPA